jgi:hypothetical protein
MWRGSIRDKDRSALGSGEAQCANEGGPGLRHADLRQQNDAWQAVLGCGQRQKPIGHR